MASITADLTGANVSGSKTATAAQTARRKKAWAAVFALGLLAGTIAVLVALFLLVGQRVPPVAYTGLQGFPSVGAVPTKTAGDIVTFVFATIVGFLIQRSRWCNASAVRDAILFRSFRNTKPLVAGMMIITAMFTIFESAHIGQPINIVGGAFTVLGLFMFGIGMVLGGACTVSVWIRSAEGSIGALWALMYTLIGMFLFSELWNVFRWPAANYLQSSKPNLAILSFGSFNAYSIRTAFGTTWGPVAVLVAGALQVVVLGLLYRKMTRMENTASAAALSSSASRALANASATVEAVLAPAPKRLAVLGDSASGTGVLQGGWDGGGGSSVPPNGDQAEPLVGAGVANGSSQSSEGAGESAEAKSAPVDLDSIDLNSLASMHVDRVLDCSGEMCPRPQLLTKRAVVREMSLGQVLELVVDNPSSPELVPTIMNDIGAVHLGTTRDALAWHLYIRKEKDSEPKKARGGNRR